MPLENPVRAYAWGSLTVLPELVGAVSPAAEPWAEIWMGAHPGGPSLLPDGRPLSDVEPDLPFLVKLLAAERPLSIQAHPDRAQAVAGYAAEEAAGIALSAPERSYKDANHKPELLVALTPVSALCGFRAPADVLRMAASLGSPAFSSLVAPLNAGERALREVFEAMVGTANRPELLAEVVKAATAMAASAPTAEERSAARWALTLATDFPADPGVLAPFVLQLVELEPGQGLFVASGVLHAYLHGAGVEIQASSDNVLRGALTPKHVDVQELLKVVRFEVGVDALVLPVHRSDGVDAYPVPAADFALWRVRPSDLGRAVVEADGPRIVVCVEGSVEVAGVRLEPGRAAFVPASVTPLVVHGDGTCFVSAQPAPQG